MSTKLGNVVHPAATGSVTCWVERYLMSDRICIQCFDDDGAFATLSTNCWEIDLGPDEFIVNHDLTQIRWDGPFLASGLFCDTGKTADYGFVRNQPIWRLSDKAREIITNGGCE